MLKKGRKYSCNSPFTPAGTQTKMGSTPGREQSSILVLEKFSYKTTNEQIDMGEIITSVVEVIIG